MKITFWGTRGSIASPGPETVEYGGNTTCLEVNLDCGRIIVIDAGTGIRRLGDHLLRRNQHLDIYLLLTHVHWDHILGFPFFAPIFHDSSHIMLDGCRQGIEGLKRVFSSNYIDGTWPIRFEDLKARIEPSQEMRKGSIHFDDAVVEPHPIQHPQGGMGFKFIEGKRAFVFLTDNELLDNGWAGTSFKDFVRFCMAADILVHDCQYTSEEIQARRGWGHSDVESVARLAVEAEVKKLVLFHHDPWRTDEEAAALVESCAAMVHEKNPAIIVEGAREGGTMDL
ncbi:MAG: MBL fold metallo-hydrolase [Desulfomonile tiedjei]|uniref:MBL fold metallo-hydrolase n=1 Tax=Desulfomonile tiedjei TaxID=2358 RepID=A0A9D6V6Q8_9BACT|nr:MBL fold metallo-hydrolase [Desulfomonile tiedjei]